MSDFQKVALLSDIPEGHVKAVEVDAEDVAICNVGGTLYAVSDICSHAHAHLSEGELEGKIISCPLHGATFDVTTGKALCPPAVQPIAKYTVEVRDGEVWIKP